MQRQLREYSRGRPVNVPALLPGQVAVVAFAGDWVALLDAIDPAKTGNYEVNAAVVAINEAVRAAGTSA